MTGYEVEAQTVAPVETQQFALLQFALQTVQQAALLARRIQAEMVTPALTKSDRSPVTVADFTVQALVARRLMQAFSEDPLIAEEDSSTLRDTPLLGQVTAFLQDFLPGATAQEVCDWIDRGGAETGATSRFWLLDPIDGTKGFLRDGQYAVALALVVDGQVQVGVLGCPQWHFGDYVGCLVYAVRGQGAWATSLEGNRPPVRLQVSGCSDPSQARLLRSFEAGHTNVGQIEQCAAALGIRAQPVLMDSQVKYAVLAAGQGDLMLRLLSADQPGYREKAWDQAAGTLVVQEAGGRATDLDGRPFDFTTGHELVHNRGVLVSNGRLHEAALRALKTVGA